MTDPKTGRSTRWSDMPPPLEPMWTTYDYEGHYMVAWLSNYPERGKYCVRLYANADEFTTYSDDLDAAFDELIEMHKESLRCPTCGKSKD